MAAATLAPVALARPGVATRSGLARPAGLRTALRPTVARVPKKFVVRAETKQEQTSSSQVDVDDLIKDLSAKWDAVENKSSVAIYGAGAIVLVWLSSTIVSAVNAVPLLPKFLELVGLGYSAWFVYRYLLFKSSREELIGDVDELKKKITGGN